MERLERLNVLNELFIVSDNCTRPGGQYFDSTVHGGTVIDGAFMSGKILVLVVFASNLGVECILEHFLNDNSESDTWRNSIK